ncbi:beta-L-arabinofuranosidase domain-containing protein [Lentilactobacillus buchneri]|uniref:beta-L-arabinofuranosidase domain-containing protein n=1 Tax=Lentilactobacillus buchneri TaxID=1581 RepID=UPI0012913868|nr:beta-L-arabinofuranosidase domain-containing protein [Lentilactobacillus buchneri]MQN25386.1 acetyl-CoA carboxylase biotin carboxyl carrier protein subunit [Lentilactobacillus buchneri]
MKQSIDQRFLTLTDPEIEHAQQMTVKYLLALDPKRFLVTFDEVAGIDSGGVTGYQGWERTDGLNFRGHFFGHYLSALSQAILATEENDIRQQLLDKLRLGVNGLQSAQAAYAKSHPDSAGYVSAFREVALDEVEGREVPKDEKENVLVPWYNLHKVLAGLLAVKVNLQGIDPLLSEKALKIAHQFGIYVFKRLNQLADPTQMLKIEYSGMNDALYELFDLTDDKRMLTAATYFDETALFKQLVEGDDVLAGKHANTTIPKLIGALHRYESLHDVKRADQYLSPEEKGSLNMYLKAAVNFWQIVVDDHTYVTGGNSQSEHFHEPGQLFHDAVLEDGATTCETCNTYNMLKLSRELFRVTGDKKYLDYYEQTYTNAILGSQNPNTGMMTYFQPMAAGYTKVYNRPFDEFWCCTGTGIENFTKLGDSYDFMSGDQLYLSLYFSNVLRLDSNNLQMTEQVDRKTGKVHLTVAKLRSQDSAGAINLKLRNPAWLVQSAKLAVDGISQQVDQNADFWEIDNAGPGTTVDLEIPMSLKMVQTKDNPHYVAFKYGPYVLAGQLGKHHINDDRPNGVLVRISTHDQAVPSTLTTGMDWHDWQQSLNSQAVVDTETTNTLFELKLPNTSETITFVPYYQTFEIRYGVYFQWQQAGSKEAQRREEQLQALSEYRRKTVGQLDNFDQNNFEFDKHLEQHRSEASNAKGRRFRVAHQDGWFSYQFSLAKAQPGLSLELTLNVEDAGHSIVVGFNDDHKFDQVLTVDQNQSTDSKGFYHVRIPISVILINQRPNIKLVFRSAGGDTARLFGIRLFNR